MERERKWAERGAEKIEETKERDGTKEKERGEKQNGEEVMGQVTRRCI